MASSKDILQTSRTLTHRPSLVNSYTAPSLTRQVHSRPNSHTVTPGPLTSGHRVTRRKSVSNSGTNMAAVAAVVAVIASDANDKVPALPIAITNNRRSSKSGGVRPDLLGPNGLPSPPASMPAHKYMGTETMREQSYSAVDEQESITPEDAEEEQKDRSRQADTDQPHKEEGRKFNRPEVNCHQCGKGYKHSSCLTKHLWEHTPEWSLTSKLLISKHQQVQLLEAASVLVAMNNKPTSPPDSAREISPSVSGDSSERLDGRSSANTTPPPKTDAMQMQYEAKYTLSPTLSDDEDETRGSSLRSLHPLPSGVVNWTSCLDYYQKPSPPPCLSSTQGDADYLVNAVAMLSCSHGSNAGSLASCTALDIPPMPPVPAQFLSTTSLGQSPFLNSYPSQAPESFTRGERRRGSNVHMDIGDHDDVRSRARSDEDDLGVFGQMEE